MAMVADLTQEVHRTKAMAMIGASIGISFGVAMTLGPIIAGFAGIQGIFWLTAILSFLAIFVVLFVVPNPEHTKVHRDAELDPAQFTTVLALTSSTEAWPAFRNRAPSTLPSAPLISPTTSV